MSKHEKVAFSSQTLRVAKHMQRVLGQAGAPLVSIFTGSSCPAYHQLEWFDTPTNPEVISTVRAEGDAYAGRLPRNWNRAIIMATGHHELKRGTTMDTASKPAVAFVSEGVVHVGVLPDGVHFGDKYIRGVLNVTAALRQSRHPIEGSIGLYLPDENCFFTPGTVELIDQQVPVNAIPHEYRWTPLA